MKSFLILLALLIATLAAGYSLVIYPVAHADGGSDEFLAAAREAGYNLPNETLLRDGYLVCTAHSEPGVTDDLIEKGIQAAQRFIGQGSDSSRDQLFVDIAVQNLCPEVAGP